MDEITRVALQRAKDGNWALLNALELLARADDDSLVRAISPANGAQPRIASVVEVCERREILQWRTLDGDPTSAAFVTPQSWPVPAMTVEEAMKLRAEAERELRLAAETQSAPLEDDRQPVSGSIAPCSEPAPQQSAAAALPQGEAQSILLEVLAEVDRARGLFPLWPTDPLHALAILGEEFGELTQAVMQATYESGKSGPDQVRAEAIQTAAMALRFLVSLDRYQYRQADHHAQDGF